MDEIQSVLSQDVVGNLRLLQAVLPGMIERRFGRLVLISSMTVPMGSGRYGLYSLSKGALESLFLNLAVDYGSYNILSNIVRPGTIRTQRTKRFWSREKYVEKVNAFIPQGAMGTPAQVAEALDPLLSATSYMNGSVVAVSGGLPLVRP
jgi:3-oxoacyl-[acyl-carrier protein] reductase